MAEQLFERTFGRSPEARAYAREKIEFIGNHADYNGGCALGAAVDRGITVAMAGRSERGMPLCEQIHERRGGSGFGPRHAAGQSICKVNNLLGAYRWDAMAAHARAGGQAVSDGKIPRHCSVQNRKPPASLTALP